jgi:hypothetical protein
MKTWEVRKERKEMAARKKKGRSKRNNKKNRVKVENSKEDAGNKSTKVHETCKERNDQNKINTYLLNVVNSDCHSHSHVQADAASRATMGTPFLHPDSPCCSP